MRPIILITMGDPAGIGPEVAVKALMEPSLYAMCKPVIVGTEAALFEAAAQSGAKAQLKRLSAPGEAQGECGCIEFLQPASCPENARFAPGKVDAGAAEAAFACIVEAIRLTQEGQAAAVATAPINKEALHLSGHNFSGHTEIFAHYTGAKEYAMLLVHGPLRVIHCTTHVSLRQACDLITRERVLATIRLANLAARQLRLPTARIAVAGLNPHCSENGLFGWEEERAIAPAIADARQEGIDAIGPVPPDTVFVKAASGQYDMAVAMYHDQGHIPVKLLGFHMDEATGTFCAVGGVNITVGLPIIRTSVDHGTAFDQAGKNRANPQSMIDAIRMAARMAGG